MQGAPYPGTELRSGKATGKPKINLVAAPLQRQEGALPYYFGELQQN